MNKGNFWALSVPHTIVIARLDRAIQYSETPEGFGEAAAYWMPRRSLSSGSPKARPGGGA